MTYSVKTSLLSRHGNISNELVALSSSFTAKFLNSVDIPVFIITSIKLACPLASGHLETCQ